MKLIGSWAEGTLLAELAVSLALLLGVSACATTQVAPTLPERPVSATGAVRVVATPVPLNPADPAQTEINGFKYAGGVELTSPDTGQFHGLSDLAVAPDGSLVSVMDDGGTWLSARVTLDRQGRLTGMDRAVIAALKGPDGVLLQGKVNTDAEGAARWPNGDLMISFERNHRILIYPAGGGAPREAPKPDETMPDNDGMEGLAIAPSQGPDAYWVGVEGGHIYLCHLAAACTRVLAAFNPPPGWRLSALTETPGGDLVVMHAAFDPVQYSRIKVSVLHDPLGAATVAGTFSMARPLTVDNFEGISVVSRPGGVLRFYLIVDDNFSASEKTYFMAFDWLRPAP